MHTVVDFAVKIQGVVIENLDGEGGAIVCGVDELGVEESVYLSCARRLARRRKARDCDECH